MANPMVGACAASVLFNLPGYRVLEVSRVDPEGRRRVVVATTATEAACPRCGTVTGRVHQRTRQRLRDLPFDGPVEVVWVKRRWRCAERLCPRTSFTEATEQVPPRARMTTRLKDAVVDAVAGEARAIDRVALQFAVSWPTVMQLLRTSLVARQAADRDRPRLVRWLGIDEHRFRSVRWFRDPDDPSGQPGRWRRVEPWMTCLVDLSSGNVVDVIDGRNSAAVRTWLQARPRWWRHRVEVVAIDPSAPFRSAVRSWLPKARISVDHFHLVKLANDMVTAVRRRVSWDRHDRRGRKQDLAWAHRLLLLRGYDTLSERGRRRLDDVLAADDPTLEISAAWGVKEQLRRLLACRSLPLARLARTRFNQYVAWAAMPETTRLKKTIDAWWPEIETFIDTRATNARTEAANVTIKNLKRAGRGYRSPANYRCRIMAYNAARSAA
jgi:transposase